MSPYCTAIMYALLVGNTLLVDDEPKPARELTRFDLEAIEEAKRKRARKLAKKNKTP